MIRALPFDKSHLENFVSKTDIPTLKEDIVTAWNSGLHTVLSLRRDNQTVCFAGVKDVRPGVGELWLAPSVLTEDYKCEFFKVIYRLIYRMVFPEMGFHRLEMAIATDWPEGDKWACKLGFSLEGIAKAWDSKRRDHAIYAKVVG